MFLCSKLGSVVWKLIWCQKANTMTLSQEQGPPMVFLEIINELVIMFKKYAVPQKGSCGIDFQVWFQRKYSELSRIKAKYKTVKSHSFFHSIIFWHTRGNMAQWSRDYRCLDVPSWANCSIALASIASSVKWDNKTTYFSCYYNLNDLVFVKHLEWFLA